jgi:hypothetical protein
MPGRTRKGSFRDAEFIASMCADRVVGHQLLGSKALFLVPVLVSVGFPMSCQSVLEGSIAKKSLYFPVYQFVNFIVLRKAF